MSKLILSVHDGLKVPIAPLSSRWMSRPPIPSLTLGLDVQ